ncbi:lysophospholipid acyltransferase family protein [Pusillimonas sp. SM2304]|uniref:lysophospholipid acyltransferase family protein n=1 Tax=Pusillimonas sp. SM2304 TaxID=3073241 RepID=UPI00287662CA|nr:lysophospholipid acyltransferase family protein [Pusillimonas sp. SM2304]MDS1140193.1 lysophospholipid acyltransferase family protein [Pusillimonas sp. SM2304]
MTFHKLPLLRSVFAYFGRASAATRRRWARVLGWLAPRLLRSRAHVVRTNLALCFPDRTPEQREAWLRRHFHLLARSVVDRGLCWFGPAPAIMEATPITGLEHLDALLKAKRRIIMLAPHFIGLDAAATRLTLFLKESATMYTPQSDADVDTLVREGRGRFNTVHLVSRSAGVRGLIRHLRNGVPVYYLPDMDFRRAGSVFVPFFGVQAATLLATAQIAKSWDAAVVPIISRLDEETGRYAVEVLPPLEDFPGEQSAEEATARLNALVESWVRVDPPQYYWVHRRFKTRPEGEARIY